MRNVASHFRATLPVAVAMSLFAAGTAWSPSEARAQVIERGVQGGVLGAIIGGVVGGGRGAGRGAAIGAGVGLVTGAAEAEANARARAAYESQYYGPPPAGYGPPPAGYGAGPANYGPPPGPQGGNLVYDIQASLTRLGYSPGPVDGVYGQRTADAIMQFQADNRLPVNGQPSSQLLNYMISQGG